MPERKVKAGFGKASAAYERLAAVGQMVVEFIRRSKNKDNKTLARYADQLRQLLEKWEAG